VGTVDRFTPTNTHNIQGIFHSKKAKKNNSSNERPNKKLKVITLSGVEGIGRNCYVVQYKDDIFIIDYGMTFPEGEGFGVDYILPDYHWLMENKHKIKALIVTHAHLDHVGGIPYVIEKLGYPPIYSSPFGVEFIRDKLKETGADKFAKFHTVEEKDVINFGEVKASFFHVTHSIPQCYGVCLHTPEGRVVYTGDYKLDDNPINEKPSNYDKITDLGKQGVLVALMDSTNAFEAGKSKSEMEILAVLEDIIREAQGRVIIATFSSLVTRMAGVLEVAHKLGKKIFFTGRSVENNIKIAMRVGYIHPHAGVIIREKDLNKYPDNQLIIITTGSQGEPMAALTRMAFNKHKIIQIKKTDTILISSSVIPTNTLDVQRMMDELAKKGVTLINTKLMNIHVSGHAYQEDMKTMARMLNAKYYIPVHGYTSFLNQHKILLAEMGIPENNIAIAFEGSVFGFENGSMTTEQKLKTSPAIVVGEEILEKGESLIYERRTLASEGFICVTFVLKDNKLLNHSIILRGFGTSNQAEEVLEDLKLKVPRWYKPAKDQKRFKRMMYARLGSYFNNNFGKSPLLCIDVISM
jgi:ribonuclease J